MPRIGFLCILHTWGQNLLAHHHVHCVVPAGGFRPITGDGSTLTTRFSCCPLGLAHRVPQQVPRLLRQRALVQRSRSRFQSSLVRALPWTTWFVYAKPPFGGPAHVLRYLGRYTHRIAISNHRLLAFDGQRVTFRWRDYAHGSKQRLMTLDSSEFLRRFFLHVLPKGFVRIRRYGYLANAAGLISSHWLASSLPASLQQLRISPTLRKLLGVAHVAEPT